MSSKRPSRPSVEWRNARDGIGRLQLRMGGSVQGVGLRPRVYRAANELALCGWVRNESEAVVVEVEGGTASLERFLDMLDTFAPPIAVETLQARELYPIGATCFEIESSRAIGGAAALDLLAPDLGVCQACLLEVRQPGAQREGYAFTSCAECGPRYSLVAALPFDRERTSLRPFALCALCAEQYATPSDRRFHAQTIACPNCGPQLQLCVKGERVQSGTAALHAAAALLSAGQIVAILGVGGFQLLVDATNKDAVVRLRQHKRRPGKPLAVMFRDRAQLLTCCEPTDTELDALQSAARPIVVVQRRTGAVDSCVAVAAVAIGSCRIGALLPAAPLHALLLDRVGVPLVCTSGNLANEPLIYESEAAQEAFDAVADGVLLHDRHVLRPLDDSVVQCVGTHVQVLRRARGYVPSKLARISTRRTVLALGGHLKSSFALSIDGTLKLSPHLGDLHGTSARERLRREVRAWLELSGVVPELIACDQHPDYASTALAEELALIHGAALIRVQHHHAHIAAVLAEHDHSDAVLGLAWDGAGYGPDRTLWGGEALWCQGAEYRRVAHLRTFPLPGAERALREPRRALLGALHVTGLWTHAAALTDFDAAELSILERALERRLQAPSTSSMGRLFDAVAALLGLRGVCDFEGQAADELMQVASRATAAAGAYPFTFDAQGVVDWQPMLHELVDERARGVKVETLARRFHETLVQIGAEIAQRYSNGTLVLSGGCFQNPLLLGRMLEVLPQRGIRPLTSWAVPVNDGGLAVGQAWVAAQH